MEKHFFFKDELETLHRIFYFFILEGGDLLGGFWSFIVLCL